MFYKKSIASKNIQSDMKYVSKKYLIALLGSSGSNGWAREKRERTESRERLLRMILGHLRGVTRGQGNTIPREPNHCGECRKIPTMSQVLSSIQCVGFQKDAEVRTCGRQTCPGRHLTSLRPWVTCNMNVKGRTRKDMNSDKVQRKEPVLTT